MIQTIIWSQRSIKEHENTVNYLLSTFGQSSVDRFHARLLKKLHLIQTHPTLYQRSAKRDVRKAVVNNRLIIFYTFSPRFHRIEIISLWDTRRKK